MGEGQESRYHAHTLPNQRGEDEAAYVANLCAPSNHAHMGFPPYARRQSPSLQTYLYFAHKHGEVRSGWFPLTHSQRAGAVVILCRRTATRSARSGAVSSIANHREGFFDLSPLLDHVPFGTVPGFSKQTGQHLHSCFL